MLQTLAHNTVVSDVTFSPDGRFIVSVDGEVHVWQRATGTPVTWLDRYYGGIESAAFSPDGRWLAFGNVEGLIRVWNVRQHTLSYAVQAHNGSITALTFSPDSMLLASGPGSTTDQLPANGYVSVRDARTEKQLHFFQSHHSVVHSVLFYRDSHHLISAGFDEPIRFWTLSP